MTIIEALSQVEGGPITVERAARLCTRYLYLHGLISDRERDKVYARLNKQESKVKVVS